MEDWTGWEYVGARGTPRIELVDQRSGKIFVSGSEAKVRLWLDKFRVELDPAGDYVIRAVPAAP